MPLDPKALTLPPSSPLPPEGFWLEQLLGTAGDDVDGIKTWTGTPEAASPATVTSAVFTGPQTYPSAKTRHSATGLPLRVSAGNDNCSTPDSRRKPSDPVST